MTVLIIQNAPREYQFINRAAHSIITIESDSMQAARAAYRRAERLTGRAVKWRVIR